MANFLISTQRSMGMNWFHFRRGRLISQIMITVLSLLICSPVYGWNPPKSLVGIWSNKAEIFFAPFKKGKYPSKYPEDWIDIKIAIKANGEVEGQIGAAKFVNCKIKPNRGWLGRTLRIKTDYIIYNGYLSGKILPADNEGKRRFTIPFNLKEGNIKGSFMIIKEWQYPEPMFPRLLLKKQN